MKRLEQNYTFVAATKQVTFRDLTQNNNPLVLSRVLLITNVQTNIIIYNFADPLKGGVVAGNVLTLDFDTTAMSNSDPLQIYYDFPQEDSYSILPNAISTGQNVSTTGPGPWLDVSGFAFIAAQLTGGWTGAIIFETNNDASANAFPCYVIDNDSNPANPIKSNGMFSVKALGQYIRYNVISIIGSVNFDIDGRSVPGGLNGIESLATLLDTSVSDPLKVSFPIALKQDASGALIPSDTATYAFNSATVNTPLTFDTTGYDCVVFHQQTAGIVTPTASNDGQNFLGLNGYLTTAPNTAIAATAGAGITVWPVTAKFFRLTGPASLVTGIVVLRDVQFTQIPTNLGINVAQVGGTATVNAGVAGIQAVGGNIAPGVAPTANPVLVAGIDTSGLTRRILTDLLGRLIAQNYLVKPDGTEVQSGALPNFLNGFSQETTDVTMNEGITSIELMAQVLQELKILTTLFFLANTNGLTIADEPGVFRADPNAIM